MKLEINGFEIKLYCYYCDDCEERFYTEELIDNSIYEVHCPVCGSSKEVSISSGHLEELEELRND